MNYSDITFGCSANYSLFGINAKIQCEVIAQAALIPEFETMSFNDIIAIDERQWHIFETAVIRRVAEIANIFVPANVYGEDVNEERAYYIKDAIQLAIVHAHNNRYKYADIPLKGVLFVLIEKLIHKQLMIVMAMQETEKKYKRMSVVFDN